MSTSVYCAVSQEEEEEEEGEEQEEEHSPHLHHVINLQEYQSLLML
jgi:hypothetical protein